MLFGKKKVQDSKGNIDKRRIETRAMFADCLKEFPDTTENDDRFDAAAQVVIDCFTAKIGAPELSGKWWEASQPSPEQKQQILNALDRLRDMFNVNDSGLLDKHYPELSRIYLVGSLNTEVVDPTEFVGAIDSILLWGGVDQIQEFLNDGLGAMCVTVIQNFTEVRPSLLDSIRSIESRMPDFSGKVKKDYKAYEAKLREIQDTWDAGIFLSSSFAEIMRRIENDVELPLDISLEGRAVKAAFERWRETYNPLVSMTKPMKYAPQNVDNSLVWSELYDDDNCVGYIVPGFVPETAIGYFVCQNPWTDKGESQRVLTEIFRVCLGCDGTGEIDDEECIVCDGEKEEVVVVIPRVKQSFDRADEFNAYLSKGMPVEEEVSIDIPRAPKFCTSCGVAYENDTAKFCVECGTQRR